MFAHILQPYNIYVTQQTYNNLTVLTNKIPLRYVTSDLKTFSKQICATTVLLLLTMIKYLSNYYYHNLSPIN